MKIDKALLTVEKLIDLTKSQKITWYAINKHNMTQSQIDTLNERGDTTRSYYSPVLNEKMCAILLFVSYSADITLILDTDKFPLTDAYDGEFIEDSEKIIYYYAQTKRLYNIVCDLTPSIEEYVDEFLKTPY